MTTIWILFVLFSGDQRMAWGQPVYSSADQCEAAAQRYSKEHDATYVCMKATMPR